MEALRILHKRQCISEHSEHINRVAEGWPPYLSPPPAIPTFQTSPPVRLNLSFYCNSVTIVQSLNRIAILEKTCKKSNSF